MLIAFAHILGSIIVVTALGIGTLWIATWESQRNLKREQEEIAIRLGVSVADLESEDLYPKLIQLSSERFSNDLLRNRISDLAGVVQTAWTWLGTLVQITALGAVIWLTFSEGVENAIYAWVLVAIAIFFWVASVLFSLLCRLLTGRYPGQAKTARKSLIEFLRVKTA